MKDITKGLSCVAPTHSGIDRAETEGAGRYIKYAEAFAHL